MREINDGGPAFPFKCQGPTTAPEVYYGMTLRDWFAGQAASGLASIESASNPKVAEWAYEIADAMIAARNKPTK